MSTVPLVSFNVSGVAMSVISSSDLYQSGGWNDTTADAKRAGKALNAATRTRMGAGVTFVVRTDLLAAGIIWEYCHTLGSTFITDTDPDTRRDGRALLAVAERVEICCVKSGWGKPTKDHGPVPPPGETPTLYEAPVEAGAEAVLMRQQAAQMEARRRNAAGETMTGCVAEAQPYPPDSWGGEEDGWRVVQVVAGDGADPVRARRNTTPLSDAKHWSGKDTEYALMGGAGEPVRTWEDMRLALSGQLQRYLGRFPDPAGAVDDALAYRVGSLIVGDHYKHPATVAIARGHLLAYVAVVRKRLAGGK